MSKFIEPVEVFCNAKPRRKNAELLLWVCDWEECGHAERKGEFFIQAAHFIEADQIGKRVVRDQIMKGTHISYKVNAASLAQRLAFQARQIFGVRHSDLGGAEVNLPGSSPESEKAKSSPVG